MVSMYLIHAHAEKEAWGTHPVLRLQLTAGLARAAWWHFWQT
jgi:hypothetical protein